MLIYAIYKVGRLLHPKADEVEETLEGYFSNYTDAINRAVGLMTENNVASPNCPFTFVVRLEEQ